MPLSVCCGGRADSYDRPQVAAPKTLRCIALESLNVSSITVTLVLLTSEAAAREVALLVNAHPAW